MSSSGKLRIPTYIKPKIINVGDLLKKIQIAIDFIYDQKESSLSYQALYDYTYQIILNKQGEFLYNSVEASLRSNVRKLCSDILFQHDEYFLKHLLEKWKRHVTAITLISEFLMCMDRIFVRGKGKMSTLTLGNHVFSSEILSPTLLRKMQGLLFHIIERDRKGEEVANSFLLRDIIDMLIHIPERNIYEEFFERDFLRISEEYFKLEAQRLFESLTVTEYTHKVRKIMKLESDRHLHPVIQRNLDPIIKEVMISNYVPLMMEKQNSGILALLNDWRYNDLNIIYIFLKLVPESLEIYSNAVQDFLISTGVSIVREDMKDSQPIEIVEGILLLKSRTEELLKNTFSYFLPGTITKQRDQLFVNSCKKAWIEIVNINSRFSEYLSLYIDSRFRKEDEVKASDFEQLVNHSIDLIRFTKDRDLFESHYNSHLARRLLQGKFVSIDTENSFIVRLRTEFGCQFTSKMDGKLKDIQGCQEFNTKFNQYVQQTKPLPIDLSVKVLRTGGWPFAQPQDVQIPSILLNTISVFEEWYGSIHNGRKLSWFYNLGDAQIRMNGFSNPIELNVTTFQMLILLLFNTHETLTLQQMADLLNIPPPTLKKFVSSLSFKTKVHDRILNRPNDEKVISETTVFKPNEGFRSKKFKIKILPVVTKLDMQSLQESTENLVEERKLLLDSTIVKLMKARRVLSHKDLILEATNQLCERFMPSPDLIKRQIESLIEKEYLERIYEDGSSYSQSYKYIA